MFGHQITIKLGFGLEFLQKCIRPTIKFKTNFPYLSGDVFSDMCDYKIDNQVFNLERLQESERIFVKGDLVPYIASNFGYLFNNKTVVVSNSDQNFSSEDFKQFNAKALFVQNLVNHGLKNHFTLPIGIENLRQNGSGKSKYFKMQPLRKSEDVVLVPPMGETNLARRNTKKLIANNKLFLIYEKRLPRKQYFKLLSQHRFVLVLEGNGFDTHRLWEVLYQGSFPVMLRSNWAQSLQYLSLPILMLDDVEDIDTTLLKDFLSKNKDYEPEKMKQLWAPWWQQLIMSAGEIQV